MPQRILAQAKQRAVRAVNTTLIEPYWTVGGRINRKIAASEWGDGMVDQLALFERTVLNPAKVSPRVRQMHPEAASVFKDSYLLEFLDLPQGHAKSDLHRGLLLRLKKFLIELGRDFCFVGSEHPVQVGRRDFALDCCFFTED